jgi:hypothetical protein
MKTSLLGRNLNPGLLEYKEGVPTTDARGEVRQFAPAPATQGHPTDRISIPNIYYNLVG